MKKALSGLFLILALATLGFSQGAAQISRTYDFTTTGSQPSGTGLPVVGLNIGFIKTQWDVSGNGAVLSACTFTVQGSVDGLTWVTIISAQTCTSDGQTAPIAIGTATSYLRVNVSAFTAASNPTPHLAVNISGWNEITGASTINPLYITTTNSGVNAYTGTGSTVTVLSTTSGTSLTTNTIYIGQISCYNITGTAATINRTDTAGTQFEVSFSIPANSNYLRYYAIPEKMVGLKMWAGTASAIDCTVSATQ